MAFVKMQPYTWIPSTAKIYGVEWAGTSDPAWTRTDNAVGLSDPNPAVYNGSGSSPFDTIMPWAGMKRVTDSAAGTLVEIPKYYYKWTRTGTKMKLQIADSPVSGFHVSPAHVDRGDGKGERDLVYVGAYPCVSTYKSTSGVKPLIEITRPGFRTGIHNLGSDIWQWDFAMYWTITMLYLVEYAHWNSQLKIGYGCGNGRGMENNGLCDSMVYHTGTNTVNRTTYGHVRYRWIEGLWSNVWNCVDGIYFSGANIYCIKNPANFSDTSGGTLVGTRVTTGNGFASAWTNPTINGFEYALYPSEINGTDTTYVCDTCNYSDSDTILAIGGYFLTGLSRGLFTMFGNLGDSSYISSALGSRLMKLP